ncbi:MAG TPA: phosphotransferase [Candidatus Angelobacter sp.]|nr:phosphotransferase [Candidatus Angelobacter sp.]
MADARPGTPPASAAARSSVRPAQALATLAGVERGSPALRDLPPADAGWMRRGRLLVRADRDPDAIGIELAGDDWTPARGLPALAADAVVLSSHPGARLACRAFYLESGVTVALQGAGLRPSRLLAGSRVAARFEASEILLVPHQLERGRRLLHAWIIEERLLGTRATRATWPDLVDRVIDGVVSLWRSGARPRPRPVRDVVSWVAPSRVRALLEEMSLTPSAPGPLETAVARLADGRHRLLVGWTHGDPVPNNVLRMDGGRLALVDWERGGWNPLGLDACRLLAALDDPRPAIGHLEQRFGSLRRGGALSMREQAAIALIGLLPTWAGQQRDWHDAGRQAGYRVRNRRRLRLLEALLEV